MFHSGTEIEKEIRPKGTHPSLYTYTLALEKEDEAGNLLEEVFPQIHASSETEALNKAKKQYPRMDLYETFERVSPWKPVAKKDFGKHEYRVWLSNKKGDVREWIGLAKTEEDAIAKATQSEGKGFGQITQTGISEFYPFGKFTGFENYDDEPPAGILYGTSNENFDDYFIRVKESLFEPFTMENGKAVKPAAPPISSPPNKSWWTKVKNVFSNPAEVDVDVIDEIIYGYGFPPGTSADQICHTLAKDGVYDPKDPQQAETVNDMVADYLSDVEDPYCVGCGKEIGENEECESVEGGLICLDCDELEDNPALDLDELELLVDEGKYEFEMVDGSNVRFHGFVSGSSIPDFSEMLNHETDDWGTDREKFQNAFRITEIEEGDTPDVIAEFAVSNGILPPHLLEDYKEFVVQRIKNLRRSESKRRASRSSTAPVEKEEVHFSIARPQRAVPISSKWPETGGGWERPDNWRDLVIYEVTTNDANPQAVLDVIQTVIEDNEDLAVYVPTKGSRIIIRGLPENIDDLKELIALRLKSFRGTAPYNEDIILENPHGGVHEGRCEKIGRAAKNACETTARAGRATMAGARGARDSWRRNPYPDTNRAGVISYNNAHPSGTPVASSTRSWDADAVRKKADARKMYHASTWVEPGKEEDKSAYKFPHHYADGDNTLSPRGVAAAMAALMGARSERWGGPHFPDVNYESARRGIYKHLAEHYRRDLGREPPPLEPVGGRERLPERKRKRLNPHSGSQRPGHVADSLTNSQMDIMDDYNDRQIESDDPKMAYSWKELPKRLKDKILKIKHHPDTIRDADDYLSGLYDSQWDLVKDTHY